MDEQKPSSSWDDLIKQVGAAPPPDALERKRPAIETTFEPPPQVNVEAVRPKPGDWNALASELGLKVPEEPPRQAPAKSPGGPSSNALEASLAEIEPMESDFEDVVEDEIADIDFVGDEEEDEDEEDDFPRARRQIPTDADALAGEAARNAFEALFEAGSFSALPPVRKPEPPEGPKKRGGPQWRELEESRSEAADEEIQFEEVDEFGEEISESKQAGEGEEGRERPRRRRRRRRGGRGQDEGRGEQPREGRAPRAAEESRLSEDADREEAELDDEDAEGESTAEGDSTEKPVRRRRRRRRRGKPDAGEPRVPRSAVNGETAGEEEDDDDDEDHDEAMAAGDDDDDGDEDSPRGSHKNIPTWSEAISVMVETNLQSRKNSPSRPSGPRERGRGGRGRGRGGSGGGRRGKP